MDILDTKSGTQIDRFFYGLDPAGNVTTVANGSLVNQFARPDGLASSTGTWTGSFAFTSATSRGLFRDQANGRQNPSTG